MALVPLIVGGTILGLFMFGKKSTPKPASSTSGPSTYAEAMAPVTLTLTTYSQAMAPGQTDISQLQIAATFLDNAQRPDLAAHVRAKIASLQASPGAASSAVATYESGAGGRPSEAQLDAIYKHAMDGATEAGEAEYAWSILTAYGRIAQAATVRARIDALRSTSAPPEGSALVQHSDGTTEHAPLPTTTTTAGYSMPGEVPAFSSATASTSSVPSPGAQASGIPAISVQTGPIQIPTTATFPGVTPPPVISVPAPSPPAPNPPLATAETSPELDPNGTVALARTLINREGSSGWKEDAQAEVRAWQSRVGVTSDGKFGPGAALKMAQEVGTLPRIRYWPKSQPNKDSALASYRADLNATAAQLAKNPAKQAHAAALRVSAQAETGQGWPDKPTAISQAERKKELAALTSALQGNLANAGLATALAAQPKPKATRDVATTTALQGQTLNAGLAVALAQQKAAKAKAQKTAALAKP